MMLFRHSKLVTDNKPEIPVTAPSKKEINRIVRATKKTFINGVENIAQHERVHDSAFIRSANAIPDTSFIAASGPRNNKDMADFFKDTLFSETPITHIVALGNHISNDDHCAKGQDFLNYFMGDEPREFDDYHVAKKHLNGGYLLKHVKTERHLGGSAIVTTSETEWTPDGVTESEITVSHGAETKTAKVIGFELKDGTPLSLKNDKDDVLKEALWKILKIAEENRILVHCMYGHGRTGHLILTLELLKHYALIFSSTDPTTVAANIHEVLANMRQQRPGLVHTSRQLTRAIRNVITLYHFGLEMGYVHPSLNEPKATITSKMC